MPEQKVWVCPNCQWEERSHPVYGWSKHNDRAVEVHKTILCPALHHEYWDDDDMPDQPEILAEWADEGRPL